MNGYIVFNGDILMFESKQDKSLYVATKSGTLFKSRESANRSVERTIRRRLSEGFKDDFSDFKKYRVELVKANPTRKENP